MDEEEAKTEFCSNCRRDIPAANFVMHVTHCQRNLTLCKECGEPVPFSQQEEHFEEYHAEEKCDCGQLVEKMNLEEHKEKDCPNRVVECQYCELTLPFNKMTSHVEYCGSRTEKCDICDRFIQVKDLTEHVNTGCQYPPVKEESKRLPSSPPHNFFSEMPVGMLHAMGLVDSSVSSTDTDYFHPLQAGMLEFGRIINTGLGTFPFSDPGMQYPGRPTYFGGIGAGNGAIDGSDVISRGAKRSKEFPKPEFNRRISRDFDEVDNDDDYTQVDDDEMIAAAYQADEFDYVNGNVNGMSSAMVDETFPNSVTDADKTQLPCEFCGDLFPGDALILHQSGCQLSSLDSLPGSASRFPDDSAKRNLHRPNNSTLPMVSKDRKFQTNHTDLETEARKGSVEDDTFLPCEFCQELFPFENLIAHQAICDACPASRPPSALFQSSTQGPPLNNARDKQVRTGSTSRPSRPVYESKKTQKAMTDFIPSELEDGDDLDFTPNVNENLTTRDLGHKTEKYSDQRGGHGISPMNNELQRKDRRAAYHQSMPGQAVLRNNDLANRQPKKDALREKNRTAEKLGRRQPEPKLSSHGASYKAPEAKPREDGLSEKKPNAGSRGKPAAEMVKIPIRVRPSDVATGSQPRLPSMNDEMERYKRAPYHKVSHKSEARPSKPRRPDSGGLKFDSSSATRVGPSTGSKTTADSLPPIGVNGYSSAPSNPRRNPPTARSVENGNRPNRGSSQPQGSADSTARPSNTAASTPSRKSSSTRKKIV